MKLFELITTLSVIFSVGLLGLVLTVVEPKYPVFSTHEVNFSWVTHYNYGTTTASGKPVREGMVATSDRTIPFGTKVLIDGKLYIVEDRTAKWVHDRQGLTFDIYSRSSTKELMAWGKRKELIEFIK